MGATGHIAKNLIFYFSKQKRYRLHLFSRNSIKVKSFLKKIGYACPVKIGQVKKFGEGKYDVVINCTGFGAPEKIKAAGEDLFRVTEYFDNMILDYLKKNPKCLYINFSSGAVYGKDFANPADDKTVNHINVNKIEKEDLYSIAKINSEAKHRAAVGFNIIDIRVFAFFSRFIDISSSYLMADVMRSVKGGTLLVTGKQDITRDYAHPRDLFAMVEKCINAGSINTAIDIYSRKPVRKSEILKYFGSEYGLRYTIDKKTKKSGTAARRSNYYSKSRKAFAIGYVPEYGSLEALSEEADVMMKEI